MIPYSTQFINNNDKKNVLKVLNSKFLTTGPAIENFEKKLAKKFQCKYSVVVNSATSALHLACLSLGLGKKDTFWTSPISFVSSANCALLCGSKIDFVDIDSKTFNISMEMLEKKFSNIKKKADLPKIIMPVHLSGNPCDMKKLKKLSRKYKFKIIEDASHASGSKIGNNLVGSCKFSDIAVFSFHPVKTITSGEGGAILTNSKKIYEKVKILRNQGISKKTTKIKNSNINPWHYEVNELGFNYRMTDLQAALGSSQLDSLKKFILKRNKIAEYYKKKLSNKVHVQYVDRKNLSTYHLFIIRVKSSIRNKIVKKLIQRKIVTSLHYIPIYRHKLYRKNFASFSRDFPESENYYKEAISLPIFYKLSYKQLNNIIFIVNSFFK